MVHHLQSAAADLERYEDLLRRFQREYQEIQGHGEDLLHHQQELQIHGQALLRLHEDSRRHAQSVRRLYEDNQNHATRLRSMEGMVRALFNDSLNSIRQTLSSSEKVCEQAAVEERANKSEETSDTEDDLLVRNDKNDDGGVDSYAAKTLIDLAGQEQKEEGKNNPVGVFSGNVSGGGSREVTIASVDGMSQRVGGVFSGNVNGGSMMRVEGMVKGKEMMKYPEREKGMARVNLDLGCRFHPTDQELIACLEKKVAGESTPGYIREKNLYGTEEPEEMFRSNSAAELYFFTSIKKKYDQGRKIDRMVGKGTWKIQSTKNVYDDPQNKSRIIGFKRTLNFVEDPSNLERRSKNSWIMHEYILDAATAVSEEQGRWAICRIKRGRNNRIGLPPTSAFSPIAMCLKRPGEDNTAYQSLMPDTKIAKTSNVLLLKSATASILPEPKKTLPVHVLAPAPVRVPAPAPPPPSAPAPAPVHVSAPAPPPPYAPAPRPPSAPVHVSVPAPPSAPAPKPAPPSTPVSAPLPAPVATPNANVEAPQHNRGQDQRLQSSLDQASAEAMCEKLDQASAEVTCENLYQAAEAKCEKLDQASSEATCEKMDLASPDAMCDKLKQAPVVEMMCEKLEQAWAEATCEKLEQEPLEMMCEKLEQAPVAKVMCEKLEQELVETKCEKLEQEPLEMMGEKSEQASVVEVTCEKLERAPLEVMCEKLERVPLEVVCEKLEQAPLEVMSEKLERAPLEVSEKLERAPLEVACEKLEHAPDEVMCEELQQAPAEVICEKLEQAPLEVVCEKSEQAPAEVMLEQAPAEVVCEQLEEVSTEVICEELDEKNERKELIVYRRRPKKGSTSKVTSNKTTSNVETKINTSPKKRKLSARKLNYKLITDLY